MIILNKLKWSNCFSYGSNNELDLSGLNIVQIIGENGSGKSSIPLIIEEALFNKNSKGVKKADIPNRLLDGTYNINLEFTIDDDKYEIDLNRSKSLKLKLLKNEKDISSHTATNTFKTIEEIMGCDFKTFSQLVYQNPKSSLQFLTATDATRKKFLIDLLGLSMYVEYFELFKERLKDYTLKTTALESKIDTIEKWLNQNNLSNIKVLPKIDLDISTEKDEEVLASLKLNFKNLSKNNKKITNNNHYKEQLNKFDMSKVTSIKATQLLSSDNETKELGVLKSKIKNSEGVISKMCRLGAKCPTCAQPVDESFKQELLSTNLAIIKECEDKVLALNEAIKEIKSNNKDFEQKKELERDFEILFRSVDNTLPIQTTSAPDLEIRISKLSNIISDKKEQINSIIKENLLIEKNNTKYLLIKEQQDKYTEELKLAASEYSEVKKIYGNLELLKKAFSTTGLLTYKIENLVKELEDLVNNYLAELSDGRFTLEFAVLKDKLNVVITDNGANVDILSLSSGELARVNTATLLAIRKLMNSISKSQINVLFLDEVISVLDTQGREKLIEILTKEDKLNTFIVSHEYSHPLVNKLSISKVEGISRVTNG